MSKDNKIAGTYEVSPASGYAGDVAPATAWKILSEHKDAVLIDVRTRAEWNYVGLPDLDAAGQEAGAGRVAGLPEHAAQPGVRGRACRARSRTRRRRCCFSVGVELDRPRRRKP